MIVARLRRAACGLALATGLAGAALASPVALVSTVREVRVRVPGLLGMPVRRTMFVTMVRTRGARKRPFLVLLHGRPGTPAGRKRMGRVEFPGNAAWFAERGFAVLVPTRVGYGVTGGPDVEATGPCIFKDYARGMRAAVDETQQLLRAAADWPQVDARRGLIIGDSFGGIAAIAAAAARLPGVLGVVNFSGGDGGDLVHHIDHPCRADQMASTVAAYGRRDRVPTLWLYSANDRYWGPKDPRRWFAAFRAAGGRGRFIELPADKNNGHFIFNRNPPDWHGALSAFTASLRLP